MSNALSEFSRHGYEGTSLRTIASLSHVDVALISHHFGSKLELWKAVVDYLADSIKVRSPFNKPLLFEDQAEARAAIEEFVEDLVQFSFEHPHHSMFLSHEAVGQNERSEYLMNKMLQPTFQALRPFIEGCMKIGAVRQQNGALFFLMLINSVSLLATMPHYAALLSDHLSKEEGFKEEMKRSVLSNFFHIGESR
nr:TetR/AcrR family transcriptional regulator [Paenibacillus phyllosphaerae]